LEREAFDVSLPEDASLINFIKRDVSASTNKAKYSFSEKTASLLSVKYKSFKDNQGLPIDSLLVGGSSDSASALPSMLFLPKGLELPSFVLLEKEELENGTRLLFQSEFDAWIIKKEFFVKNDSYQVDMKLKVVKQDPEQEISLDQPRIVFYAPYIGGTDSKNKANAVSSNTSFDLKKVDASDESNVAWKFPYLFGAEDRFFLHSLVASKTQKIIQRSSVRRVFPERLALLLELSPITGNFEESFSFYFGPKKISELVVSNKDLEPVLSFGFLSPLCKFIIWILEFLNSLMNNYGFAIIVLALILRALFWPLMFFAKKKGRKIELFEQMHAGDIAEINRKFANNITLKTEHLSRLYSDNGMSQFTKILPLLPELLQLPIIFALYRILMNYISLYNAPFVFWITDLSSKDPYFVLPFLLFAFFWIQQNYLSAVASEKNFITKYALPFGMFVIFQGMPAGLVLYWVVKTVIGLFEELCFRIMKRKF
jgi:YidC/Oxa1 family membrane protein insertase